MSNSERGKRRTLEGEVVSTKMDKTVVVRVDRRFMHPRYKKFVIRSKRYLAHDESNSCHAGDRVLIVESRPMSARKRWSVREIQRRAHVADSAEASK
jgi:small subunit ribosomal protein S17